MHNFRGFSDTLVPLSQTSFLVGENSTGKSSFLKLLYLLSRPHFWFSPDFTLHEDSDLGGFQDIVSAWAVDKAYFQIGVLATRNATRNNKRSGLDAVFTAHTFVEKDGAPELSRYLHFADKKTRVANSTKERVAVIVLVPFLAKRGDAVADSNPKIRGRRPQQVGESVSQAQFAILEKNNDTPLRRERNSLQDC
jgi:hypothetical protein